MTKKTKDKFIDDGHTVYNMNVDGFKWYDKNPKKEKLDLSKKEKNAMIRGALAVYLPRLLCLFLGFGLAILLLYFWLKK